LVNVKRVSLKSHLTNTIGLRRTTADKEDKMKKRRLREASVQYTPEKIDEFVKITDKYRSDLERVLRSVTGRVEDMSIKSVNENPQALDDLLDKVKEVRTSTDKVLDKYYPVVEQYDLFDRPDNIKRLENNMNKVDNMNLDLSYLQNMLDSFKDSAKEYKKIMQSIESEDRD
jgi:hypothetical protein